MEKIDFQSVKTVFKFKNPQVVDPPRFPKLIIPLENLMKKDFSIGMNKALVDIAKKMIDINTKK